MKLNSIIIEFLYEFKFLRRDVIFSIFVVLAMVGGAFYQFSYLPMIGSFSDLKYCFFLYQEPESLALSSSIPFKSAYYFNIIQLLLVVFVTSSDYRRLHLSAMGALDSRPQSNSEIVIGRLLGKVLTFSIVNVLALVVSLIGNAIFFGNSFDPVYYLFYWVTLSFPALIFLLGLSGFVTGLIRHQGISVIILLLLLGSMTILGTAKLHGLLDPLARNIPNVFSDLTGHVNLAPYLLHRLIYFVAGISFCFFSIMVYPRIPNYPCMIRRFSWGACGLLILSLLGGMLYYTRYANIENSREEYRQVFKEYELLPKARVISHDLSLKELPGGGIRGCDQMKIINRNLMTIPLFLYLNPGLKINELKINDEVLDFQRKGPVLLLERQLKPGEACNLYIDYEGGIVNEVCFLDIEAGRYNPLEVNSAGIYHLGNQPAFCEDEYKLLTPECLWYPVCVPPYNVSGTRDVNFSRFSLNVEHDPRRMAISQGDFKNENKGKATFSYRHDMPGISLCIGNYKKRMIMVDSVRLELYYFPGHEYLLQAYDFQEQAFGEQLASIKQSLEFAECIQTEDFFVKRYSGDSLMDPTQQYPYKWLTVIEAPVHFHCFSRGWKATGEREQEGMVFFPEKGYSIRGFRYELPQNEMEKENILAWFAGDVDGMFGRGGCDILPIFRGRTCFISSREYPVLNDVFVNMGYDKFGMISSPFSDYPVIEYLKEHSLKDALHDESLTAEEMFNIIQKKSVELHKYIMLHVNSEQFRQYYHELASEHLFEEIPLDECFERFHNAFNVRLDSLVESWSNTNRLPSFEIKDARVIKIGDTDIAFIPDMLYSFKIYNKSDIPGLVMTDDYQGWVIPPHEGRVIKTRNRKDNRNITTPYIGLPMAQNLPGSITLVEENMKDVCVDTVAGVWKIDSSVFFSNKNEIIVDNEDSGFKVLGGPKMDILSWFGEAEPEKHYYENSINDIWRPTIDECFYGSPIRSALIKLAENSRQEVEWSTRLPEEGKYEVFFYHAAFARFNDDAKQLELHYIVFDGKEEHDVIATLTPKATGWVSLGMFEFSRDGKVILCGMDRSKKSTDNEYHHPQVLVADAVKWVRVFE